MFDDFDDAFRGQLLLPPEVYNGIYFHDTDEGIMLEIDLPGVKHSDLDVKVRDGTLSVNAQRKATSGESKFSRSWKISKDYDVDAVSAKLEDGVLFLSIAKRPEAQKKTIDVKVV